MSDYTFPFDTCEKPNKKGMAQPYSVIVNFISTLIIIYFLCQTRHFYSFILIFTILIFEIFHNYSHMVHIKGKIQTHIIHFLGILINFLYMNALYNFTHVFPNKYFIFFIFIVLCVDMYSIINLSFMYYFATQLTITISTFLYYYRYLPHKYKIKTQYFICTIFIIFIAFMNEKLNCKKMLSMYPDFPFHAITEIIGVIAFYLAVSLFYKM